MTNQNEMDQAIDFLVETGDTIEHFRSANPFDFIRFAKKNAWLIKAIQLAELNPSKERKSLLEEIEEKARQEHIRI